MRELDGSPELGWGRRRYRTSGAPQRRELDGEWGIGFPLKRPSILLEVLFVLIALGLLVSEAYAVLRLARDPSPRTVVGMVFLLPFVALFVAGSVGAHRLRVGPERFLTVTPTRVARTRPSRLDVNWNQIEQIRCVSYSRRGSFRRRNLLLAKLTPDADYARLSGLAPIGRLADRIGKAIDRQVRLLDVADLDVDPWQVAHGLRTLAADPSLRPRLATDAGPAFFTTQPGRPSR